MPDPQIFKVRSARVVQADANTLFKATYSGVPVYEMMVKSVAIMRRRSDSWLNATQILKIAGFDKPQRTRVLEREVQKGEHEKVQGGYGKYQGTWVPLDKGIALARQHNIDHLMKPLIDFQPAATSPPLAPKHLSAPSRTKRGRETVPDGPSGSMSLRSSKRGAETATESRSPTPLGSEDGSMTTSPGTASATSRTPSPIRNTPAHLVDDSDQHASLPHRATRARTAASAKHKSSYRVVEPEPTHTIYGSEDEAASSQVDYADAMLEYFISESTQIPAFLITPPETFDPNMSIDEEGHAALHWACAMGRIRIIKLLLTVGADIFRTNAAGQTPLMRGVMFSNNYDVRKFPELYELLHRSTLNIDHTNRTVFHHIVDLAMTKGKTHAARYYMETILNRLSEFPNELADIINFQAEDGETALTLAARCRSKRLVKLLIDHGADPKIANKEGKSAEDYILEDERFRSSPVPPSRISGMSYRNAHASMHYGNHAGPSTASSGIYGYEKLPLHHSVVAQRASTTCVDDMANMLDSLAESFDAELQEKERDLGQAHALLNNIDAEIAESQKAVEVLKRQAEGLDESKMRLRELEQTLKFKMGRRYQLGWAMWLREEETREQEFLQRGGVLDGSTPTISSDQDLVDLHSATPADPDELAKACDELRQEMTQHRIKRKETFDALIMQQAEAGTGGRMPEYRRLIGAGCGGVPPSEVDNVLGLLLETLESEESSTEILWNGPPQVRPSVASAG
ncbi:transcription factor [Gautieria morchelliformis]|nr:transcription factor [Gautieria morchelliformis]